MISVVLVAAVLVLTLRIGRMLLEAARGPGGMNRLPLAAHGIAVLPPAILIFFALVIFVLRTLLSATD